MTIQLSKATKYLMPLFLLKVV